MTMVGRGVLVSCVVASCVSMVSAQDADSKRFFGTWRLVSIEGDSLSRLTRPGEKPTGYIYYDATGHMAVQIQPDRPRPSWTAGKKLTGDEAIEVVTGYIAYFGTWQVDPAAHTVTHHREGALNFDVVDYVRRYEFIGSDRIALMPVDRLGYRLVWERVKRGEP